MRGRARPASPVHSSSVSTNLLQSPVPARLSFGARGLRQWTTPTRLKAATAAIAALTVVLALVLVATVGGLRGGIAEIGGTAGPEVENTAALSGTLSDLDAQVANLLLAGKDPAFARTAAAASAQFTADQTAIDSVLQSAIAAAGPDAADPEIRADAAQRPGRIRGRSRGGPAAGVTEPWRGRTPRRRGPGRVRPGHRPDAHRPDPGRRRADHAQCRRVESDLCQPAGRRRTGRCGSSS